LKQGKVKWTWSEIIWFFFF